MSKPANSGTTAKPCIAAGRLARTSWPSWLALPSRLSDVALHLLVVLELDLEELHHLDRGPGRAGDRDAGEVVGREHLLDAAAGDHVAGGGPPVAGHDHAAGEADRHDGRAVRDRRGSTARRCPRPAAGAARACRSTSANDGPGSTDVENSGSELDSDIGAGAYRRGFSPLRAPTRARTSAASSSSRSR